MSEGPRYPLAKVKDLIDLGRRIITGTAAQEAGALGFDEADIEQCIQALGPADFYKAMESEQLAGTWQDVYRPTWCGIQLYVKVQIVGKPGVEQTVVIQFKRK